MPVSAAAEATKELLDAAYILPGLIGASLRPAGLGSAQYTTPGIASTAMEMSIRVNTLHYIGTRREVGLTDRVYSVSFVGGTLALTKEAVSQVRAAIVTADLEKRNHHCYPSREKHISVQKFVCKPRQHHADQRGTCRHCKSTCCKRPSRSLGT